VDRSRDKPFSDRKSRHGDLLSLIEMSMDTARATRRQQWMNFVENNLAMQPGAGCEGRGSLPDEAGGYEWNLSS
jgi:hypothetical protein